MSPTVVDPPDRHRVMERVLLWNQELEMGEVNPVRPSTGNLQI